MQGKRQRLPSRGLPGLFFSSGNKEEDSLILPGRKLPGKKAIGLPAGVSGTTNKTIIKKRAAEAQDVTRKKNEPANKPPAFPGKRTDPVHYMQSTIYSHGAVEQYRVKPYKVFRYTKNFSWKGSKKAAFLKACAYTQSL